MHYSPAQSNHVSFKGSKLPRENDGIPFASLSTYISMRGPNMGQGGQHKASLHDAAPSSFSFHTEACPQSTGTVISGVHGH